MQTSGMGKGGMGMGEVMAVLGREWRERKEASIGKWENIAGSVAGVKEGGSEDAGMEDVARKLNFLDLSAED